MSPRWIRPLPVAFLGAGLALALAGCGSGEDIHAEPGAPAGTTAGAPSSTPTSRSSGEGTGAGEEGRAGDRCHTADLDITMSRVGAAAGSRYFRIRLRNTSDRACTLHGFGGLSFVDDEGRQIGAAAERDPSGGKAHTITLEPGDTAASRVQQGDANNYPPDRCRSEEAAGLRVYPPNATRAKVVAYSTDACSVTSVSLLQVRPYRLVG